MISMMLNLAAGSFALGVGASSWAHGEKWGGYAFLAACNFAFAALWAAIP